jgi:hypothetical protein
MAYLGEVGEVSSADAAALAASSNGKVDIR